MKKLIILLMVFALGMCLFGCGKSEESEYPFYFIAEIVGEDTMGGLVKVVDYGNYNFNSEAVIMHEVKLGQVYSVGDYIRVEFDGAFLDTLIPQIKSAISIKKIDAP